MANRDNPYGFVPFKSLISAEIPTYDFPVDASNGTNLFVGDAVIAEADGNIAIATADAGDSVLGVITALYDTSGIPVGHPNAAESNKYLSSSTAGFVRVALAMPFVLFRVQSDTGTNVAETARFQAANHVQGTGDTTTGKSRHELDASDIGTGSQLKIIDKVDEPNNAWDDAHVDLLVVFAESYWYDATAAI